MIRIGYVRAQGDDGRADLAILKAANCQVVRLETSLQDSPTLSSVLDFIGASDELVVTRLDRLASTARAILKVIERLEAAGASLLVLEPAMSTRGASGRALVAVLEAVVGAEPGGAFVRRNAASAQDIQAMRASGMRPSEIARQLGVSRMTVWRKLKSTEAAEAMEMAETSQTVEA